MVVTSNATQTVNFNGTTYFSFDGRPGGVGTARHLTIANTSTIGNAALFINGAQNCGFNYCNIRGVNTSTASGVILFQQQLQVQETVTIALLIVIFMTMSHNLQTLFTR